MKPKASSLGHYLAWCLFTLCALWFYAWLVGMFGEELEGVIIGALSIPFLFATAWMVANVKNTAETNSAKGKEVR